MYQNDYLMRQIWGLTQWVRKQTEQHPDDEARKKDSNRTEIGEWYRRFRLPTLGVWLRLSEADGVRLLSSEGSEPDVERLFAAAQILIEEARIATKLHDHNKAFKCTSRGLYCGLVAWRVGAIERLEGYGVKDWIESQVKRLTATEDAGAGIEYLSLEIRRELVLFYEQNGEFDQSENVIFSMVDEHSTSLDKFVEQWVSRLRDRSQIELMRGGISRAEIEESWHHWRALRARS